MQKGSMKNFRLLLGVMLLLISSCKSVEKKQILPTNSSELRPAKMVQLTGRIVNPSNKDYETARLGWDKFFSSYPAVIVYVQNPEDVKNAVNWARENGIALRIRSGGHSLEGWNSVDGGIVIDVSELKSISVDKEKMIATVGTGVTQGELWDALEGTGLGFPTGDEASVGLGGVMLGGGIGVLSPKWGVACDNLLAVEIVTVQETGVSLVKADANQNSDLLWACRGGGGGNFGVATSYTVQLHPIPPRVIIWQINWPFEALHNAFEAWQSWAPTADERLGSTFNVSPPLSNHERDAQLAGELEVNGIFLGTEKELGDLLNPLTKVKGGKLKKVSQSFREHYKISNAAPNTSANWKYKASWTYKKFNKEALDIIAHYMKIAPSKDSAFWSLAWGGKVRTAPTLGSAFFHREPLFYSEPGVGWNHSKDSAACMAWASEFRMALSPHVRGGYVNVPDRAVANWGEEYYGSNFEKLQHVKRKWDPYNVFNFEQSIPLAEIK